MNKIKMGYAVASLPAIVTLALFYSLAVHMHWSLGEWPTAIGTRGFPRALEMHAHAATLAFGLLFQSLVLLPLALVASICLRNCQRLAFYIAIYGLGFLFCFALMQFAPAPFLTWWQD